MRILRRLFIGAAALAVLALVVLTVLNVLMVRHYAAFIATQPAQLQTSDTGLVLGTSSWSLNGKPSEHFAGRMDAAASLFHAGKVRRLLLSGANPTIHYNEPQRMREALQDRGVPDQALVLDYAGRRTLDSVRRARDVFGASKIVIVSQPYHLYRALFLADSDGLHAQGLAADGPPLAERWRTEYREVLARLLAVMDIYILDTKPHFPGHTDTHDS